MSFWHIFVIILFYFFCSQIDNIYCNFNAHLTFDLCVFVCECDFVQFIQFIWWFLKNET